MSLPLLPSMGTTVSAGGSGTAGVPLRRSPPLKANAEASPSKFAELQLQLPVHDHGSHRDAPAVLDLGSVNKTRAGEAKAPARHPVGSSRRPEALTSNLVLHFRQRQRELWRRLERDFGGGKRSAAACEPVPLGPVGLQTDTVTPPRVDLNRADLGKDASSTQFRLDPATPEFARYPLRWNPTATSPSSCAGQPPFRLRRPSAN